jgi:hypothetical protein
MPGIRAFGLFFLTPNLVMVSVNAYANDWALRLFEIVDFLQHIVKGARGKIVLYQNRR